jgi:hypothetical protein
VDRPSPLGIRKSPSSRCGKSATPSAAEQRPVEEHAGGIGDKRIVMTLCPGGRERMRTLMELVRSAI